MKTKIVFFIVAMFIFSAKGKSQYVGVNKSSINIFVYNSHKSFVLQKEEDDANIKAIKAETPSMMQLNALPKKIKKGLKRNMQLDSIPNIVYLKDSLSSSKNIVRTVLQ